MSTVLQPNNCIFCKKSYKKKKDLEKHIVLCEFLNFKCKKNKTKLIIEEDEEEDPVIPSQKILYQMLIELGIRYNKLEEKVSDLQKMTIKQTKKLNIIELLNTNIYHPSVEFNNIVPHIDITEKDIDFLLDNEFNDTLNNIFLRNLYHFNKSSNPIIAFVQQPNVFYIYNENNWIKLLDDMLILFLKRLFLRYV